MSTISVPRDNFRLFHPYGQVEPRISLRAPSIFHSGKVVRVALCITTFWTYRFDLCLFFCIPSDRYIFYHEGIDRLLFVLPGHVYFFPCHPRLYVRLLAGHRCFVVYLHVFAVKYLGLELELSGRSDFPPTTLGWADLELPFGPVTSISPFLTRCDGGSNVVVAVSDRLAPPRSTRRYPSAIMPPNSKAKNDLQKLKINKDKPAVSMIEKDGPIVDSPVEIDFEEKHPEGLPQDVRFFVFNLDPPPPQSFPHVHVFFLFIGSNRTSLAWYTRRTRLHVRTPLASIAGVI